MKTLQSEGRSPVDNTEVERGLRISSTEDELLKKRPHLQELFYGLKDEILKNDAEQYITGRTIRYKKHRVFGSIRLRKNYIRLVLRVGRGKVNDLDFKYLKSGTSNTGAVTLSPGKPIPEKVKQWIDIAREFKSSPKVNEDEPDEEVD